MKPAVSYLKTTSSGGAWEICRSLDQILQDPSLKRWIVYVYIISICVASGGVNKMNKRPDEMFLTFKTI